MSHDRRACTLARAIEEELDSLTPVVVLSEYFDAAQQFTLDLEPFRDDMKGDAVFEIEGEFNPEHLLKEATIPASTLGDESFLKAVNVLIAELPAELVLDKQDLVEELESGFEEDSNPHKLDSVAVYLSIRLGTGRWRQELKVSGSIRMDELFPDDALERIKESIAW